MNKNAFIAFIEKRGISLLEIYEKQIIQTESGSPLKEGTVFQIPYMRRFTITNASFERLDELFSLSEEERLDLKSIVRKKKEKKPVAAIRPKRSYFKGMKAYSEYERLKKKCDDARNFIKQIITKAEEFKMLGHVDWLKYGKDNKYSTKETIAKAIEKFLDNRITSATSHLDLILILDDFKKLVMNWETNMPDFFGQLPSTFTLFEKDTHFRNLSSVSNYGRSLFCDAMTEDTNRINSHFVSWVMTKAEEADNTIDIRLYKPDEPLDIKKWFISIEFPDFTIPTIMMPFLPPVAPLDFFGIPEVVDLVEKYAEKNYVRSKRVLQK